MEQLGREGRAPMIFEVPVPQAGTLAGAGPDFAPQVWSTLLRVLIYFSLPLLLLPLP